MQLVERKLSYKAKLDKMYRGQFYLSRTLNKEFLQQLEEGSIMQDKTAIEFIDNHGEWMDG